MNPYIQDALIHAAQQSEAWSRLRLGRFTGSGISALMTKPKSKEAREAGLFSQTAMTYITKKAMEVITNQSSDDAYGRAIDWGNEWEQTAIEQVVKKMNLDRDTLVLKPAFKLFNDYTGCSPDAFVDYEGMQVGIEVKCPFNSVNHYEHSKVTDSDSLKDIAPDYYWQIILNMIVNKLPMWLFASFDPRQPEHRMVHVCPILFSIQDAEDLLQSIEKAQEIKMGIVNQWLTLPNS
jgi:hypothetical protein